MIVGIGDIARASAGPGVGGGSLTVDIHDRGLLRTVPDRNHVLPLAQAVRDLTRDLNTNTAAGSIIQPDIPTHVRLAIRSVRVVGIPLEINPTLTVHPRI